MQPSTSPAGQIDKVDVWKTLRGALITYVAGLGIQILMDLQTALERCAGGVCAIDVGVYDFLLPLGVSAVGFAIELIRRAVTDQQPK